jgi:hypothetical protein
MRCHLNAARSIQFYRMPTPNKIIPSCNPKGGQYRLLKPGGSIEPRTRPLAAGGTDLTPLFLLQLGIRYSKEAEWKRFSMIPSV